MQLSKHSVNRREKEAAGRFFLDGPGGSGKTFLYEALIHYVHGKGKIALACAIAASAGTFHISLTGGNK